MPTGSIKIRIETIAYFLRRHRDKLVRDGQKVAQIDAQIAELERELRAKYGAVRQVETAAVVGV